MNKKINYTNEPLSMGEKVEDFLPPPNELVKRETTVEISLKISQSSLVFFKERAKREQVSYQRVLQNLIDSYVKQSS